MDFPYCFPPRADDLEASDILRPLKLKKVGLPRSALRPLMHACLPETVKKEGRTDFSRLEKCFRLIVLNLIENGRIGLYTAIPLQKSKYSKGESLNPDVPPVCPGVKGLECANAPWDGRTL